MSKLQYIETQLSKDVSIPKIAKELGISSAAVHGLMKRNNISGRRQQLRNKESLYEMYVSQQLSMAEISERLGVTYQAVNYYLTKWNIEKRDRSTIQKIATERYRQESGALFPKTGLKSRGYCIRQHGHWFASAAEWTYFQYLIENGIHFVFQPFTLEQRRPDFLLPDINHVVEVKSSIISEIEINTYLDWADLLFMHRGATFELLFIDSSPLRFKYADNLQFLKSMGAQRGYTVEL